MQVNEDLIRLKSKHISEIVPGMLLTNLGEILEIDELENYYSFVISRMNEKQVFKFEKQVHLYVLTSVI